MKITADTDVLVRALTDDDQQQSKVAQAELAEADLIAIPLPVLCELVWVLSRGYAIAASDIVEAIRRLVDAGNVAVNHAAVDAGLAMLDAGGDFADGVIAFEGAWLGGDMFVSFDKRAVTLVTQNGGAARLLA